MRNAIRAFADKSGISAVEFAIIAPVLGFTVLALIDAVTFTVGYTSMQRAERAALQYFMNGGTSIDAAKGIVAAAWKNPPSNYTVSAQQVCKCGNAITVCGVSLCVNGGAYTSNMTITASGTVHGMLMSLPESKSEIVRVQ